MCVRYIAQARTGFSRGEGPNNLADGTRPTKQNEVPSADSSWVTSLGQALGQLRTRELIGVSTAKDNFSCISYVVLSVTAKIEKSPKILHVGYVCKFAEKCRSSRYKKILYEIKSKNRVQDILFL